MNLTYVPIGNLFAVRNEPKPVLRYPSIRTRLSTYLNANYGHFKICTFFRKRQKNFREQWFVPSCEQGIDHRGEGE